MQIALATGWTPDLVRNLTMAEIDSLSHAFSERAKAMRHK